MSDQPSSGNNNNNNARPPASSNPNNNNNRRHHNSRHRPQDNNGPRPQQPQQQQQQRPRPDSGQAQGQNTPRPPQQGQNRDGANAGARRRPNRNNQNRPRNPNQNPNQQQNTNPNNQNAPAGSKIERTYEKYLNLLDQHLIARRKYHDLFYRADPGQKNKLERNFYNTMNDIRDFESRLPPDMRELFEKRNNGLNPDTTYTTNHEIPTIGDNPPPETEWADPHYLRSQQVVDFATDKEESVGTVDDYLKYKNLV